MRQIVLYNGQQTFIGLVLKRSVNYTMGSPYRLGTRRGCRAPTLAEVTARHSMFTGTVS